MHLEFNKVKGKFSTLDAKIVKLSDCAYYISVDFSEPKYFQYVSVTNIKKGAMVIIFGIDENTIDGEVKSILDIVIAPDDDNERKFMNDADIAIARWGKYQLDGVIFSRAMMPDSPMFDKRDFSL